jgi:hypothetical protein
MLPLNKEAWGQCGPHLQATRALALQQALALVRTLLSQQQLGATDARALNGARRDTQGPPPW